MGTSTDSRAARHARHGPRGGVRIVLATLLSVVIFAGACEPDSTGDPAALDGLLALTSDADGEPSLRAWSVDPVSGAGGAGGALSVDLTLPSAATAWVSSGRGRVLAATLLDGSVYASEPVGTDPERLAWRPVGARDLAGDPAPGPAWFVTWDPEGGRFATITGDLPGGAAVSLTLVDPATESAHTIALRRSLLPSAPAWLARERVALVGGSTAEPVAFIVDVTTGEVADGPSGDRRLATSGDGLVIATVGDPGSPIVIRPSEAWATADGTRTATIDAPADDATPTSMALDANGSRLAIVWQLHDGLRVDVHDAADGWRRLNGPLLDPTPEAAVVAWLRYASLT